MGRPLSNSPELMPLDATLNKDIHKSVSCHLIMSISDSDMPAKENTLVFSLETLKLGACAYNCIIDPITGVTPLPHQIIDDISGVLHALHIIKEHKGVFLPGLAIRTRRQYLQNPDVKDQ